MKQSYYDILQISPCADKSEIKAAFRKMARKCHPDVNHTFEAELMFKKVNLAAKTLLDDKLREQYDFAFGFNQKKQKPAEQDLEGAIKFSTADFERAKSAYKKSEIKKETKDFSKKFQSFFNKKEKQTEKPRKVDGEDIVTSVEISIAEALSGTTRKINILETEKCPKCFGQKFVNGSKCSFCNGEGEKSSYRKINVKIPPNIKDGIKIRIKGQGHEGKNGGKDGNLYLIVHVKKSEPKEAKTIQEVFISPFEAVLGATKRIITPAGEKILKVPKKTSTNTVFALEKCGEIDPLTGDNSTLYVKVVIDISKELSDKEIELYEALLKEAEASKRFI